MVKNSSCTKACLIRLTVSFMQKYVRRTGDDCLSRRTGEELVLTAKRASVMWVKMNTKRYKGVRHTGVKLHVKHMIRQRASSY